MRDVSERFDETVGSVKGMGKAIVTAILQVAYPDKYGVWNSTSETGMKMLDLWPQFDRGTTMGVRYARINRILLSLAEDLQVSLWTLDTLWWLLADDTGDGDGTGEIQPSGVERARTLGFSLERHLHEFLRDNWDDTDLGKEWDLYSEPGDEEAGYEYPCGVGQIDLLAKHRSEPRWLVLELKRGQTSDSTVGQIMRYIGWVENHVATEEEDVEGIIIARQADKKLRYALATLPSVSLQLYEVDFRLHPAHDIQTDEGGSD